MIADILTYVGTYGDIRAVTGLNHKELPDETLASLVYKHGLTLKLGDISGVYGSSSEDQTLQEIFDVPLATSDPMYSTIQLYSIYCVANAVLDSVGLRAYKTITDGKGNLTRFSPEATFNSVRLAVEKNLQSLLSTIYGLLDEAEETITYISAAQPDIDLVIGEE